MASSNRRSSTVTTGSSGSMDFILRTAMERQAGNKRPIRPKLVDDSLLGNDSDDSDDSDFNVEEQESVSGSDVSKDSCCSNQSGSDDDEDNEGKDSSDSEVPEAKSSLREALEKLTNDSPGFDHPGGSKKKKKKKKPSKPKKSSVTTTNKKKEKEQKSKNEKRLIKNESTNPNSGSVMNRVFKATCAMRDIRSDINLNRKICSFCLGETSETSNEIMECDSCKVTVHESCYGLSESVSLSSDSGSNSGTELWLCDYCKNPDSRFCCALCPNPGGLLKATAEDQFVHLVCAQYTRGILSPLDNKAYLDRIAYAKWGNKPCTLCTSARFSTTGITVECDAGLCKQYVHIYCAQRFGLLSDPFASGSFIDDDQLFASCKLHGQKEQAKHRATLFKVLQEQIRTKRETAYSNLTPTQSLQSNQWRIQEKLKKMRTKAHAKRITNPDGTSVVPNSIDGYKLPYKRLCSVPQQKRKPRNLKSCAYSVSKFLQKIDKMGGDITSLELEERNERIVANIKKRWNVLPSLTVEFAAYYFDREARIEALSKQCQDLVKENEALNDTQIALDTVLENEAVDHMEIIDKTLTMDSKLKNLKNILEGFSPANKSLTTSDVLKGLPTPPRSKSPIKKHSVPPNEKKNSSGSQELKKTIKRVSLPPGEGRLTLYICSICKKSDLQHLITNCDNCKLNFHLGCLDPPLTRMPRRSKLVGWMCSDCCEEKCDEEEVIDTEAPRTLRGRTQLKRPEKYRETEESEEEVSIVKEKATVKTPTPKSPHIESITVPVMRTKPIPDLLRLNSPVVANGLMKFSLGTVPFFGSVGVPPHYTNVNVLKRPNPPLGGGIIRPATFHPPQTLKKMKMSPLPSPTFSVEPKQKTSVKKPVKPVLSNQLELESVPSEATIKEEILTPKKSPQKLGKGKNGSATKTMVMSLGKNGTSTQAGSSGINGISSLQQKKSPAMPKKMKLVLSPVNSENGKNGIPEIISPAAQTSLRLGVAQTKKTGGTVSKSSPGNVVSKSPRKVSPRPAKKIETKVHSTNTDAQGNDLHKSESSSTGMAGTASGKCCVCSNSEEKKNLVTCDDCSLEFHFTCVPPFLPYNPKRRGYTWVCEGCANKSDEEVTFLGEKLCGAGKN